MAMSHRYIVLQHMTSVRHGIALGINFKPIADNILLNMLSLFCIFNLIYSRTYMISSVGPFHVRYSQIFGALRAAASLCLTLVYPKSFQL